MRSIRRLRVLTASATVIALAIGSLPQGSVAVGSYPDAPFAIPTTGTWVRGFEPYFDDNGNVLYWHYGIDIDGFAGSKGRGNRVYAAYPGEVIFVGKFNTDPSGTPDRHVVVINHGDTCGGDHCYTTSIYMHMGLNQADNGGNAVSFIDPCITVGTQVQMGTYLGDQGSAGDSTGTHLHFEMHSRHNAPWSVADWWGGSAEYAVDPSWFLFGNSDHPTELAYNGPTPSYCDHGDTAEPGGTWISPAEGFVVSNNQLHFEVHAYDNAGGSGVNRVEFTASYAGVSGAWPIVCTDSAPDPGTDIYKCDWDLSHVPAGYPAVPEGNLTVSFDVWDNAGHENEAPHGLRHGQVQRPGLLDQIRRWFGNVWATTDQAVANGQSGYSWFWGPAPFADLTSEAYAEAPDGARWVQYYDKSRMEVTNPNGDPNSIWFVTNGLLTSELVTGRMQLGNNTFEQHTPSSQLVAGDPQNNPGTPSYAEFARYATTDGKANRSPDRTGQTVTEFLDGNANLSTTDSQGVTLTSYQNATGHNIASVFWSWANSPSSGLRPDVGVDWLYVLGYPITEPYWIDATVGGTTRRVLVQLFERRALTYTPGNPAAYQVEFGNIGRHYYEWRYGAAPPPTAGVPTEGTTLLDESLLDYPSFEDEYIAEFVEDGAFHVRLKKLGGWAWQKGDGQFVNTSTSIDVININMPEDSQICLVARTTYAFEYGYNLCIDALGNTYASYWDVHDGSNFQVLLPSEVRPGTVVGGWNRLKIIWKDTKMWFFINDALIGYIEHNGPQGGYMGFSILNPSSRPAEAGFRNLLVRAVS